MSEPDHVMDLYDALEDLHALAPSGTFLIYLLHLEPPCGHAQHYVGSVEATRIRRRLLAHANGYGAAYTRAAVRAGCKLYLVRLIGAEDRSLEAVLIRLGGCEEDCCMCRRHLLAPRYAGLIRPTCAPPGGTDLAAFSLP